MANESYNLRGLLVRIEDTDKQIYNYHYLMFIDLPETTQQSDIPPVTWTYTDIELNGNTGKGYVQGIYSNVIFPAAPTANSNVRTFYIGMCTTTQSSKIEGGESSITATLSVQGATTALTTGDPCSRKPPIVKVSSINSGLDASNPVYAPGIQSRLGEFDYGSIHNHHNTPDFFAILLCWCPPSVGYTNVLQDVFLSGQIIVSNPTSGGNVGDDGSVVAVACFDCTVDGFCISNHSILGNGKNSFSGSQLPTIVQNNAVTSNNQGQIFWAEI